MSSGSIYAIGMEGTSLVKIGCTASPIARRIGQLQTGQPYKLLPLACIPVEDDMAAIERQIHVFLATERRRGEWFDVPMDEQALVGLIARAVAWIESHPPAKPRPLPGGGLPGLGQRIVDLRKARQMSQQDLCAATNLSQRYVSILEHDKVDPRITIVRRVAEALGLTLAQLVEGTVEREKE